MIIFDKKLRKQKLLLKTIITIIKKNIINIIINIIITYKFPSWNTVHYPPQAPCDYSHGSFPLPSPCRVPLIRSLSSDKLRMLRPSYWSRSSN